MKAFFILVIPVVLMLQTAACYAKLMYLHRRIGPDVLRNDTSCKPK